MRGIYVNPSIILFWDVESLPSPQALNMIINEIRI